MQKIMQDQGSPVPINLVNKPGGGSAIAYNYVNQHPGDARFFVLASKSLLTNFWQADFRNGTGFRKVLDEDNAELSKFLNELGLVKKK